MEVVEDSTLPLPQLHSVQNETHLLDEHDQQADRMRRGQDRPLTRSK